MAKNIAILLTGTIGNVVISQRNGNYYARAKRTRIKQTPATKRCGGNFGRAATLGSRFRSLLAPALPFPKDQDMQRGFSGAINRWFRSADISQLQPQMGLPFLQDFTFNTATGIRERFRVPLEVTAADSRSLLQIPAFVPTDVIMAPAGTTLVHCTVVAASSGLDAVDGSGCPPVQFTIPYTTALQPAQTIPLPVPAGSGFLVLTAMRLVFEFPGGRQDVRPAFLPAAVIDARYC